MSMLYKNCPECVSVTGVCVCVFVKRELVHTGIVDPAHVEGMKQNVVCTVFLVSFLFLNDK